MFKKLALLNAVVLCTTLHVCGQTDFKPGFIIRTNKDSVAGFVAYKSQVKNYSECVFRETPKGPSTSYKPGDIEAFGVLEGKRYVSKELPDKKDVQKKVFAQHIIGSQMSLYKYGEEYYLESDKVTRLPKKTDVVVHTIQGTNHSVRPGRRYVGLINYLMLDCSISANEADYKESDIAPLVVDYNRCKKATVHDYRPDGPSTKFSWQLFAGTSTSSIKIDDFNDGVYKNSSSGMFGASMEISVDNWDKSLLTIDIAYLKESFKLHTIRDTGGPVVQKWYSIDADFLKLPIGFRHNFLTANHSPYIKLGYVQYFAIKSSYEKITEINDDGDITSESDRRALIDRQQAGFWLAAGYSNKLTSSLNIFAEVRYEKCFGLAALNDQEATITSVNILAGIRF